MDTAGRLCLGRNQQGIKKDGHRCRRNSERYTDRPLGSRHPQFLGKQALIETERQHVRKYYEKSVAEVKYDDTFLSSTEIKENWPFGQEKSRFF